MKKIFILFAITVLSVNVFSQSHGIRPFVIFGPKGMYSSTFLFNKNVSSSGDPQNTDISFGHSYGFMVGVNFKNSIIGIETEYQMSQLSQKYNGNLGGYTSDVTLTASDIPLLLKLSSGYNGYLEVGPQFSMIKTAKYSYKELNPPFSTLSNIDKSAEFSKTNLSAVLGFGTNFNLADEELLLRVGFRLSFGLLDIKGTDAFGQDLSDKTIYPKSYQTHSANISFLMGLTYQFEFD